MFDVDLPSGAILRSVNTGGAIFNSSGITHHCASGEGFIFTEDQNGLLKYPIPVREMTNSLANPRGISVRFFSISTLLIRGSDGRIIHSPGGILLGANDVLVRRINYKVKFPPGGEILEWADLSVAMNPNLEYVYFLHVVAIEDGTLSLFVNETFISRVFLDVPGFPVAIYGSMGALESSRFSNSRRMTPDKSWLMLTADHRTLVAAEREKGFIWFGFPLICVVVVALLVRAFWPELKPLFVRFIGERHIIEIERRLHRDVILEILNVIGEDSKLVRAKMEKGSIVLSGRLGGLSRKKDIGRQIARMSVWDEDKREPYFGDLIRRLEVGEEGLLEHPLFWDSQKCTEFVLEELPRAAKCGLEFEGDGDQVLTGSWVDCYRKLGDRFSRFIEGEIQNRYIGEDRTSLKSLVRYLQTKRDHRQETAAALRCDREDVFEELLRPFPWLVIAVERRRMMIQRDKTEGNRS
jgi:hypothetical protein